MPSVHVCRMISTAEASVSMSTMATPRNRLPRGASGSEKLSQNAHLSFGVIGSPPILPPAAQQNRERDRTTQGRIEPMELLFSIDLVAWCPILCLTTVRSRLPFSLLL